MPIRLNDPLGGKGTGRNIRSIFSDVENYLSDIYAKIVLSTTAIFKANGSGSVERTLDNKISEMSLSVTDYGALGDGVNDDRLSFQNAQSGATLYGGALIYIPPKTYKINSTVFSSNKNAWLAGPNANIKGSVEGLCDITAPAVSGLSLFKLIDKNSGENVFFVSGLVKPTNSPVSYQKNGIYVRVHSSDPSDNNAGINRDLVGIEGQAQIVNGNLFGRVWGIHSLATANAGTDGYVLGAEFEVQNFGVVQNEIDKTNSKIALHLVSRGDLDNTAALVTTGNGSSKFFSGIVVKTNSIRSDEAFVVKDTSNSLANILKLGNDGLGFFQSVSTLKTLHNFVAGLTIADTNPTNLSVLNMPAKAIGKDGQAIRITAWGSFGTNANSKTLALVFGATNLITVSNITQNGNGWFIDAVVTRANANSQLAIAKGQYSTNLMPVIATSPAENLGNSIAIKIIGTNSVASAGDIICLGMHVEGVE